MPTGSLGNIVFGTEAWPEPARDLPHLPVDDLREVDIVAAVGDREEARPAWAPLVEDALLPDWESIDHDMRHLLDRIGGLPDHRLVLGSGRGWMLWIAAAAMLYVTHRRSIGPGRLFGRTGTRAALQPLPIGPWPLGPP